MPPMGAGPALPPGPTLLQVQCGTCGKLVNGKRDIALVKATMLCLFA